jgi:hypothetical protein
MQGRRCIEATIIEYSQNPFAGERAHHVASYPLFVPLAWSVSACHIASGLAIVLGHNVWGDPVAVVVSLLGWMMTIKGAGLMLIPAAGWAALLGAMHYPSHFGVYTIIPAVAGAYLTYAVFVRQR